MEGGSDCATLKAYPGPRLSTDHMATVNMLRADDVYVHELDGRIVRFGPFPPMGAWKEIRLELAPGTHQFVLSRPSTSGSPSYNVNSGRYVASAGKNPFRVSFRFDAEPGHTYAIKNVATLWAGDAWAPYVEDVTSGKRMTVEMTRDPR